MNKLQNLSTWWSLLNSKSITRLSVAMSLSIWTIILFQSNSSFAEEQSENSWISNTDDISNTWCKTFSNFQSPENFLLPSNLVPSYVLLVSRNKIFARQMHISAKLKDENDQNVYNAAQDYLYAINIFWENAKQHWFDADPQVKSVIKKEYIPCTVATIMMKTIKGKPTFSPKPETNFDITQPIALIPFQKVVVDNFDELKKFCDLDSENPWAYDKDLFESAYLYDRSIDWYRRQATTLWFDKLTSVLLKFKSFFSSQDSIMWCIKNIKSRIK